ncbi:MAG: IclR family transcriptional regulator [Inquilinaceae bacterium]
MTGEKVESVERALTLLECFGDDDALSLAALADRTGFYKSTILRLAASLERFGYLTRGPDGRFRLGPTLWRLGSLYRRGFDQAGHIRPELSHLAATTQETASYYVREGDSRICLYRHNSSRAARHHLTEGSRLTLAGGASARVLKAFGPTDDGVEEAAVRAAGHAVSLAERDPDLAAVAVPVFDTGGAFRGALTVSGLLSRFDAGARAAALEALRASAGRLRGALVPLDPP